ncbi:MAG: pitrilysin family protein [Patescibacteria group bacterium]|nr:pitrilysin family protein [Patescibacteria group bacterium]
MYKLSKLKNGIRFLSVPVAGTSAVTVFVLCRVGSRYETPNLAGASHFIEHLMFKGTARRPTTLDISRELDGIGAEYNAMTSKDWTGYYVKASSRHLPLALDVLSDMLWNSKFDEQEYAREKGVIIEEINMYEDNPNMRLDSLLEEAMFPGNTLGRDIAGTRESITRMKRGEVIAYRDRFYAPRNTVVIAAGDIAGAAPRVKKIFENLGVKTKLKPLRFKNFYGLTKSAFLRCRIQHKKTKQIHLALGFPGLPHDHRDLSALTLGSVILGGTMSSRLFIAIREREGLAYYVNSSVDCYEDAGIFSIRAGLDTSRLVKAASILIAEIEKFKKFGPTAEEVRRAKDTVRGKFELALEDSANQADFYGKQALLMKRIKTPQEKLREIQRVSGADIVRVAARIFDWRRAGIAIIGPYHRPSDITKYFKV